MRSSGVYFNSQIGSPYQLRSFRSIVYLLVALLGLCAPTNAQSQITHPRMLIGKDDPFTGLQILRARYAAGMRPSDDLPGWALTYLVTGDESFARRAAGEMRRSHPPELVGSRTYMDYIRWSLAFDWLYDYQGFDVALKDRVAGELLKAAERMMQDPALAEPSLVSFHNYTVRYLTLATFALTAIEGHPSTESKAAPLRERARKSFDNVLDVSQFIAPLGGYHESMDYMRITYLPMALLAELRRTTCGGDPARRFTLYPNYIATYLYKTLPDGTTSRRGDNEWPYYLAEDNDVLGYIVNRFKDPYVAWMLRKSGWSSTANWYMPTLKFLWDDPQVAPRDPALASEVELSRQHFFKGVGDLVMRNGWGPNSTWIEFTAGPYLAKHQHLDQNGFTIFHRGYLAIDSAADYTDTESPNYLNYYRRTIAHNTMLVYKPGEPFYWAENLWPAANDGGQRMDSSRYWNTIRSVRDWEQTRDLWDLARMETTDYVPNQFQYARGNATRAYSPSKLDLFTRELLYLPQIDSLIVFDHVRSTDPDYKKVWLLHGVNEPTVSAEKPSKDIGHGGTAYFNASSFTLQDGEGQLLVHSLLPAERELVKRGGPGWEFWTPGDEHGGGWGTGRNWPIEEAQGGPLPEDPYLRKMWKTFWGDDLDHISPSNMQHVVPGAWRVELSPVKPSKEDFFLNVLEIGDKGNTARRVELADGSNLTGALIANEILALFATVQQPVRDGEVTLPDQEVQTLIVTGLKPESKYALDITGGRTKSWGGGLFQGVHLWNSTVDTDRSGVLQVPFSGHKDARLRFHLLQ